MIPLIQFQLTFIHLFLSFYISKGKFIFFFFKYHRNLQILINFNQKNSIFSLFKTNYISLAILVRFKPQLETEFPNFTLKLFDFFAHNIPIFALNTMLHRTLLPSPIILKFHRLSLFNFNPNLIQITFILTNRTNLTFIFIISIILYTASFSIPKSPQNNQIFKLIFIIIKLISKRIISFSLFLILLTLSSFFRLSILRIKPYILLHIINNQIIHLLNIFFIFVIFIRFFVVNLRKIVFSEPNFSKFQFLLIFNFKKLFLQSFQFLAPKL